MVQPAWVHENEMTGTCAQANPSGINHFGRAVLHRLGELGAIVDPGHVSDPGFADVLKLYDGPVICSHTCARACAPARAT